jgi:hypothetical protein
LGLSKAWFFYLFICDGPIKDSHHPKKKKKKLFPQNIYLINFRLLLCIT